MAGLMLNKLEKIRQFFINEEFRFSYTRGNVFSFLEISFMLLNDTIKLLPVTVAYLVCHVILFQSHGHTQIC